jgi:hypothetical protein
MWVLVAGALVATATFGCASAGSFTGCDPGASAGRLEGSLRQAIRAASAAGCDPFGGMMGRAECASRVEDIRALAQAVNEAELAMPGCDTVAAAHVVRLGEAPRLIRGTIVTVEPAGVTEAGVTEQEPAPGRWAEPDGTSASRASMGSRETIAARAPDAAADAAAAEARPIPEERRKVRTVGATFLPDEADDDRFDLIAGRTRQTAERRSGGLAQGVGQEPDGDGKADRLGIDPIRTAAAE